MIFYFALFVKELYPVFNVIFGLPYLSVLFRFFSLLSFIIIVFGFIINFYKYKTVSIYIVIFALGCISVIFFILLSISNYGNLTPFVITQLYIFLLRSFPSVLLGYYLFDVNSNRWHIRNLYFISNIITVALVKFIINNPLSVVLAINLDFGGVNYNDYAYICVLNILFLFVIFSENLRKKMKLLFFLSLIINLIVSYTALFFSGGRGAILVGFMLFVVFLIKVNIDKNIPSKVSRIMFIVFSILSFILVIVVMQNEALVAGVGRAFSFINSDKKGFIDWENTSGRLEIYLESIKMIKMHPIFGYGLGSVLLIHPIAHFSHNIFLDLLFDGGFFFFAIFFPISIFVFIKLVSNMKEFRSYLVLNLYIYIMFNLLTGSNYLVEPLLWFILSFVFIGKKRSIDIENN